MLLCAAVEVPECLTMLHCLCSEIGAGTTPVQDLLCALTLIPNPKPSNKAQVRPLAIGDLLYRVLMRLLLKANGWEEILLPKQLSVGSKGGVELIARWIAAEGRFATHTSITHLAPLDFTNGYNTADHIAMVDVIRPNSRPLYTIARWADDGVSDLLLRGPDGLISCLLSAQGVRQGDPLGPLLFSITMRPIPADLEVWLGSPYCTVSYVSDVHIKGPSADIVPWVQEFLANRQSSLQLKVSKCRTASLDSIADEGFATLEHVLGREERGSASLRTRSRRSERRCYDLTHYPITLRSSSFGLACSKMYGTSCDCLSQPTFHAHGSDWTL